MNYIDKFMIKWLKNIQRKNYETTSAYLIKIQKMLDKYQ